MEESKVMGPGLRPGMEPVPKRNSKEAGLGGTAIVGLGGCSAQDFESITSPQQVATKSGNQKDGEIQIFYRNTKYSAPVQMLFLWVGNFLAGEEVEKRKGK